MSSYNLISPRTRVGKIVALLCSAITLCACGSDEAASPNEAATPELSDAPANVSVAETPVPAEIEAVFLIKDATLGGRCVAPDGVDPFPGASIASVQLMTVDGALKGTGKLLWDEAGYEVAAERGRPPEGSVPLTEVCSTSYNLGCDGQAVLEILDPTAAVQKIQEGESLIVHLRGQKNCGEEIADDIEVAICTDTAGARRRDIASCDSRIRMVPIRSDLYGPDRVGGTLSYVRPE